MNKILFFSLVALLVTAVLFPAPAQAQRKNVTFYVNTATVPDTLGAKSVVVLVGSGRPHDADSVMTSWGGGDTLQYVGGDYWKTTLSFAAADTAVYKIRIGANGYEKDLTGAGTDGGGHRQVDVSKDSTLPLQFWNNNQIPFDPNFRPYTASAASDTFFTVYFRVNLKAVTDNLTFSWIPADKDSVAVRGDSKAGGSGQLTWGTSSYLTQEHQPGDGGSQFQMPFNSFYSGGLKFRKSQVHPGDTVSYKFLIGSDWGKDELQGGKPNRIFVIPSNLQDTTLHWVWYDNTAPTAVSNGDTVLVTYQTNMTHAIATGGFKNGDTVVVQQGFFSTATESPRQRRLARQGITQIYKYTDTVVTSVGHNLDYEYDIVKKGVAVRENYYNFQFAGDPTNSEAEKRQFMVPSKTFPILETITTVSSAARRQPEFPNQDTLLQGVKVTWVVDMRPAYYQVWAGATLKDGQGSADVTKVDSIKAWGVAINGPATGGPNGPLANDWAPWDSHITADSSARKLWDNATHGDVKNNDTLYTVNFNYTTKNKKGVVFKLGVRGGDNESGFGLNHLTNIDDSTPFDTILVQWGSQNTGFYTAWNYDTHKPAILGGVVTLPGVARVYALEQNYPNPFNPSTKIEFSIPVQSEVRLTVYNILGQEVATLVNGTLKAGKQAVTFDGTRLASGVYIYRMTAGQFVSTKKMMFLK